MNNANENRVSLQDQIAALKAENETLRTRAARGGSLGLKIGEKGGVSITGMGRFPVTLYAGQWEKLIAFVPQIEAFIVANASKLSTKADRVAPAPLAPGETRTASGAIVGGTNETAQPEASAAA